MTEVFRDGDWQSVDEKKHPQTIPANRWTGCRWIEDGGRIRMGLRVVKDGPQDFEYAVRIVPAGRARKFPPGTKVTRRVHRYPEEPGDNGTRWEGETDISGASVAYFVGGTMDHKGGKVGHAYGTDILASRVVKVDQWIPKLDPRR